VISMLNDILLGVRPSQKSERSLLSELLAVLIRDNPRKENILSAFETHIKNVG
jgi:hypothetical protein